MRVFKRNAATGAEESRDIDITVEQIIAINNGTPPRDVCPKLSDDDVAFLVDAAKMDLTAEPPAEAVREHRVLGAISNQCLKELAEWCKKWAKLDPNTLLMGVKIDADPRSFVVITPKILVTGGPVEEHTRLELEDTPPAGDPT